MTKPTGQRPVSTEPAPATVPEQLKVEATRALGAQPTRPEVEEEARAGAAVSPAPVPEVDSFARHVHQYLRDYIATADQKAGFVFAVDSALLVYLYQQKLHLRWVKPFDNWLLVDGLTFLGMFALLFSLGTAGAVIVPRVRKTHRGFIFFREIAEFESASDYSASISRETAENLTVAVLKHNYDLAKVCRRKFFCLLVAVWASVIGVGVSLLVLLFKGP